MAVSAPPRFDPSVHTEPDRFEALIEEARQRARRRRQTYGAVAVGIAVLVAATVAINRSDAIPSDRGRSGLDIPAGAATTAASTGELVASMHLWHMVSEHGDVWLYLYADGRLIGTGGSGVFREQRLTPEAAASVQDDIISTGLFDPDRRPPESRSNAPAHIQVRNGDQLVTLWGAQGQDWTPEFDRLAERLATLQSWLPATAWVQREATGFVPARYAVCAPTTQTEPLERAELLSQLPSAAAAVLEGANVRGDDGRCFDLVREQAQRLATALGYSVDLSSSGRSAFLQIDRPGSGSETIGLHFISILPHGAPECACAG